MTEPLEVICTKRTAPYRLAPVRFARVVTDVATFRQRYSRNDLYKPDLMIWVLHRICHRPTRHPARS